MIAQLLQASFSGAVAVAIAWALCRFMPRLRASVKAWLWCAVAAKFLVALAWSSPIEIPLLPPVAAAITHAVVVPSSAGAPIVSVAAPIAAKAPEASFDFAQWLSLAALGLWSVGMCIAAAIGTHRWRRARQMIRRASAASPELAETMTIVSAEMGLTPAPSVRVSDDVETPLVVGVARPVVVVPSARFVRLSEDEQRMALAHECAHIRRADLRIGCVPALCEAVFFFHPLARMAAREYALWREAACDAAVIAALDTAPGDYGKLLLGLGVSRPHVGLAAAGASWSTSNLKRRLLMLTETPVSTTRSRIAAVVVVVAAAAAIIPVKLTARPASLAGNVQITTSIDAQYPPVPPPPPAPPAPPEPPSERQLPPPPPPAPPAPPAPPVPDWYLAELPHVLPLAPLPPAPPSPPSAHLAPIAPIPPMPPLPPLPPQRRSESDQNFVLILDKDKHIMSGNSDDTRRAESFRRNNEPLLWFREGGHEYVVRDRAVVNQAIDLWKPIGEIGDEQGRLGAEQGKIGTKQGEIGAHQGKIGAEQGALSEKQALIELKQAEINLKASRAKSDADRREIDNSRRELDKERNALTEDMRKLSRRMDDERQPMDDLSREMDGLSRQRDKLSKRMEAASMKAEADMTKLIRRAIESGAAQQVR